MYHEFGSNQQDLTIFTDNDKTHYIDIGTSKDKSHLIINSNTKEDSEVWVAKREKGEEPQLLLPRAEGVRVFAEHLRDFWVFITNDEQANNFKLSKLQDSKFEQGKEGWEDIVRLDSTRIIEEFDGFENFITVYTKAEGSSEVLIYDLENEEQTVLSLGEGALGEVMPGMN